MDIRYLKSRVPLGVVAAAGKLSQLIGLPISRYPLAAPNPDSIRPVLIIGCGRSGNTLLRSMLLAGGEIVIPPESFVWPSVVRKFLQFGHLPWEDICSISIGEFEGYRDFYTWNCCLSEAHKTARSLPNKRRSLANIIDVIYRSYAEQAGMGDRRWGDKTPINTIYAEQILKVFPAAQFVHIVRDPRDVACSYMKAAQKSPYIEIREYRQAAEFWKASVRVAQRLRRKLPDTQFAEVRYEDLVTDPEPQLQRLCEFLGSTYSREMLSFWKLFDELGDVPQHAHHKKLSKPLDTSSIGKWKTDLASKDRCLVEKITAREAAGYDYFGAEGNGAPEQ